MQSVCSGWGSDAISCGRLSLLTKVTRVPGETGKIFGDTPADVMVIVVAAGVGVGVGVGVGLGDVEDPPPPQEIVIDRMAAATTARPTTHQRPPTPDRPSTIHRLRFRRISSRY